LALGSGRIGRSSSAGEANALVDACPSVLLGAFALISASNCAFALRGPWDDDTSWCSLGGLGTQPLLFSSDSPIVRSMISTNRLCFPDGIAETLAEDVEDFG